MTDRELMQQVLDALEFYYDQHGEESDARVIAALRERLAQPEQEPVAYVEQSILDWLASNKRSPTAYAKTTLAKRKDGKAQAPLYTSPPPAKPWLGLTDEQMAVLNFMLGADDIDGVWFGERHPKEKGAFWWRNRLRNAFQDAAIEAKLKEKNT